METRMTDEHITREERMRRLCDLLEVDDINAEGHMVAELVVSWLMARAKQGRRDDMLAALNVLLADCLENAEVNEAQMGEGRTH